MQSRREYVRQTTVHQSDVLVVGGGLAGLQAAHSAKASRPDANVTMLVPGAQGEGGCSKKTHGVNAAINKGDAPEQHYLDTMRGGGWINNSALVRLLCSDAPSCIRELETWGVPFDKVGDLFDVGLYAGSSQGRSIHWNDQLGRKIVQTLVTRVTSAGIWVLENRWVFQLVIQDGRCHGVLALNVLTDEVEIYLAKATVLATGGGACVYPIATISSDKLATGMMMAYDVGAPLIDMEMVQFHPTGLVLPGSPGHGEIFEEEVRMQGGVLLNKDGEQFMFKYHEKGERATRDIVARGSYMEIRAGRGTVNGGVIFDMSQLDKEKLQKRFPYMVERQRVWGVDLISCDQIEVSPSAHFLMGGLKIDQTCATPIQGLFAAGEDAGGIDGGNRLGGNGVAGALVFGKIAGNSAVTHASKSALAEPDIHAASELGPTPYYQLSEADHLEVDRRIKRILWDYVGPVRTGSGLSKADRLLGQIQGTLNRRNLRHESISGEKIDRRFVRGKVLMNKLQLARIITMSAMTRTNSVGAHYRQDDDQDSTLYNVTARRSSDGDLVFSREMARAADAV
jgi:succinate dehydrogenase/fumarate reductase flavoprotein subunit